MTSSWWPFPGGGIPMRFQIQLLCSANWLYQLNKPHPKFKHHECKLSHFRVVVILISPPAMSEKEAVYMTSIPMATTCPVVVATTWWTARTLCVQGCINAPSLTACPSKESVIITLTVPMEKMRKTATIMCARVRDFLLLSWWRQKMETLSALLALTEGYTLISRFMGPTWGPSGADRTQAAPCWPNELCYVGNQWIILTKSQLWWFVCVFLRMCYKFLVSANEARHCIHYVCFQLPGRCSRDLGLAHK